MNISDLCKKLLKKFTIEEIEGATIRKFLETKNMTLQEINIPLINKFKEVNKYEEIFLDLIAYKTNWGLKDIEKLFECIIDSKIKRESGIVFTPEYIVKYILENTVNKINNEITILDPACGCGAFLFHAAEYLSNALNKNIVDVLQENIFGIDVNSENIDRVKIILALQCIERGENPFNISFNIYNLDTLQEDLFCFFDQQKKEPLFDYIIGNPPYVNTHDISIELNTYLKNRYVTTSTGVYNIFYAFIEVGLSLLKANGKLGFIVPNNFIVIEASEPLRKYLQDNRAIKTMIDFGCNVPFNPIKTYNAIIILEKSGKTEFSYCKIPFTTDIENALKNTTSINISYDQLNPRSWRLLSQNELDNIRKIELAGIKLASSIRTGIATLADSLYFVDMSQINDKFYVKKYNGNLYKIEKQVVKKIVKVGAILDEKAIYNSKLGIIFPYFINPNSENQGSYEPIPETLLEKEYPYCYQYFLSIKEELSRRDKGKCNAIPWYAFGRSQGLNTYGKKLLFPTFSKYPRFLVDIDLESLFCNGYAVFIDGLPKNIDMDVLQKILNSEVMHYYISKTSYSIEGNFRCYQKKYIKNFSIPLLSDEEIETFKGLNTKDSIDDFLFAQYKMIF